MHGRRKSRASGQLYQGGPAPFGFPNPIINPQEESLITDSDFMRSDISKMLFPFSLRRNKRLLLARA